MATDSHHVDGILHEAAHGTDRRTRRILPLNGFIMHGQIQLVGEVENLDVKSATVDVRTREDRLCGLAREALEASLRVGDSLSENDEVGQNKEAASQQASDQSFALGGRPPPGDDLVRAVEEGEEDIEAFDPGGVIGVHEQNPRSPGFQTAGAYCGAFALVICQRSNAQGRPIGSHRFHPGHRIVPTAVIDDDHLVWLATSIEVRSAVLEGFFDAMTLVVSGNHHG